MWTLYVVTLYNVCLYTVKLVHIIIIVVGLVILTSVLCYVCLYNVTLVHIVVITVGSVILISVYKTTAPAVRVNYSLYSVLSYVFILFITLLDNQQLITNLLLSSFGLEYVYVDFHVRVATKYSLENIVTTL